MTALDSTGYQEACQLPASEGEKSWCWTSLSGKSLLYYNYAALKQGLVFFAQVFKAGQGYTSLHCHSNRRDYVNISCKAFGMGLTIMEKYD